MMPRTREQLEQAAREAERWLDEMDPAEIAKPESDATDLRRIGQAVIERDRADKEVDDAVAAARDNGRDWGTIGSILGVTKQTARERYGQPAKTGGT